MSSGKVACTAIRPRFPASSPLAIDRVVVPLGRRIDEAAPMVDARLPDGRAYAIIPPAAIRGASLTIRKFPGRSLTLDALTRGGSLSGHGGFLAFGVDIRELVRNALRMRPDRIVVGECRGGEAFDMLTAMNTGHEGSLTTLHANSPRDALARLEAMVLMAGLDLPLAAVREHIAASVDLIRIAGAGPGDVHRRTDRHRRPHPAAGVVPFRSPAGIRGLRRVPRFRTGR